LQDTKFFQSNLKTNLCYQNKLYSFPFCYNQKCQTHIQTPQNTSTTSGTMSAKSRIAATPPQPETKRETSEVSTTPFPKYILPSLPQIQNGLEPAELHNSK
jgi:hypothetical protein